MPRWGVKFGRPILFAVLPPALGAVALVLPAPVGGLGWRLQGFIATHQDERFAAAGLLSYRALYHNARRVLAGARRRTGG